MRCEMQLAKVKWCQCKGSDVWEDKPLPVQGVVKTFMILDMEVKPVDSVLDRKWRPQLKASTWEGDSRRTSCWRRCLFNQQRGRFYNCWLNCTILPNGIAIVFWRQLSFPQPRLWFKWRLPSLLSGSGRAIDSVTPYLFLHFWNRSWTSFKVTYIFPIYETFC